MTFQKEIKETKEKIKKLEEKIFGTKNSCNKLQTENMQSYESDILYLNMLKSKLEELESKK